MTATRLRMMTDVDLPAVLELDAALFAEEAWSREMLVGELEQQPASGITWSPNRRGR